ncbi:TolC family protein [Chitinibacter sp. S2-10]|uniref:TolC family protein n=1 Tax=Chitinibacter sp. S2-10 TaxID=3373597 RepID=UPI0039778BAF
MQSKRFHSSLLCGVLIAMPLHAATIRQAFELATALDAPLLAAQQSKADLALHNAQALTPEPLTLAISGKSSLEQRDAPSFGAREYEAELGIPLWQWGQKERLYTQLKASADFDQQQLLHQRWQLAGELREAVWTARLAQHDAQLASSKVAALQKLADDAARRLKSGDIAPLDFNLAQNALLQVRLGEQQAQQSAVDAERQFQALLGDHQLALPDEDEVVSADLSAAHHPQLQQLSAQQALARAQLIQAQSDTRAAPELAVTLTRERGSQTELYQHLGKLAIKIPFGSDGRTQVQIASANSELIAVQTAMQRTQQLVAAQQATSLQAMQHSERALALFEQRQKLAAESWQWQQRSYKAGQIGLAAFLNAQIDYLDSEFATQRARLELGRTRSRYLQVMGVLP